jgi:hypothetical protein
MHFKTTTSLNGMVPPGSLGGDGVFTLPWEQMTLFATSVVAEQFINTQATMDGPWCRALTSQLPTMSGTLAVYTVSQSILKVAAGTLAEVVKFSDLPVEAGREWAHGRKLYPLEFMMRLFTLAVATLFLFFKMVDGPVHTTMLGR